MVIINISFMLYHDGNYQHLIYALRIIYRDEDSYTALLIKADLPKLSERRK